MQKPVKNQEIDFPFFGDKNRKSFRNLRTKRLFFFDEGGGVG